MFGFLRRKKPAETPASPLEAAAEPPEAVAAPCAPADAPGAGEVDERALEAAALAAAPVDNSVREALAGEAPGAAEQAPAAKPGFWSRFIPGGKAPLQTGEPPADSGREAIPAGPPASETAPAAPAAPDVSAETSSGPSTVPGAAASAAAPVAPGGASSAPVPAPLPDRTPWLARLKQGLSRTSGNIATLFVGVKVDEALFEELETALLTSDTGVETTTFLLGALRERVRTERLTDPMQVKAALRALLVELLAPLEQPIDIDRAEPLVMMIAGVNGAGKTTSIGKLAKHLRREGKTVLLAAGDTFRAAAREQLAQWGSRNEVEVIAQQGGDPAAVAYDAVSAGIARRTGVVMVDTAGRLPTQTHLMDELRKVRRVIGKAMPDAPHEVLLVLDGNTGQNMLAQVKAFDDAVQLTGLVVTKLDGTAKGGALAALAHTRRAKPVPVYFIGVGEGIDDLQAFSADEFAAALLD
ncbi:MAG: signal recognition particle-docking protein FtsY [Burkholderiales bacterium]